MASSEVAALRSSSYLWLYVQLWIRPWLRLRRTQPNSLTRPIQMALAPPSLLILLPTVSLLILLPTFSLLILLPL